MAVGARFSSLTFLLCLYLASEARAGKLLVIPTDGSHWTGIKPLVEELGRRGNRVVVVFPEISGSISPAENTTTLTFPVPYTQEQLRGKVLADLEHLMSLDTSNALTRAWSFYKTLQVLKRYTVRSCESLLKNTELLQILKNWKFDSILTDPFEPAGVILGEYLDLHPIYVQSGLPCMVDFEASRCPYPASYVPRRFTHYSDRMTLGERIVNFLRSVSEPMACNYLYSEVNEMASKFLKKETTIPEIMSKASLWLMTVDFALEFPRPVMPNIVMIGGLNCEEPKPLPMDLEEFIEGSGDDGFVVFTLGSMVSQMPEDKAKQFVDAFRQIPQRVVWRYTGPLPDDAPKNLKVMKWLPQNDLLGHPKAKAFITHGGTHGIYEGICNGVPMVMLPLFGDQGDNVHRMVVRGVAEALNPFDVTTDKLLGALDKVINDKSYKEKMLKLSAVHMDRPIEPLDLAVFWTEFVMRHKGAEHLRPAAHDLNWIQYHSLDVIAFLTVILITASVVTIKSCLFCCRKCVGSRNLKRKTA